MRDFYQEIIDIIGAGGEPCCVIPIGDPAFENAAHTTVTTKGQGALDGVVFTYSEARTGFDLPTIYTRNQFRFPLVPWNGSDEEADSPDIDAWSRDDGSGQGFSIGGLLNVTDTAAIREVLSKDRGTDSEWQYRIGSIDTLECFIFDESNGTNCSRSSNSAVTQRLPVSLIVTYDGSGGATAADGMALYESGQIIASTATNNASYVAMENLDNEVELGDRNEALFFSGLMAALFFTHRTLSAVEVQNLDDIYVAMQRAQRSQLLAGTI